MKQVVAYVTAHHGYSERRACVLTRLNRSTLSKPSIRDPRTELLSVPKMLSGLKVPPKRLSLAYDCPAASFAVYVDGPFKPMWRLEAENAALRQQLMVLRRKMKGRPRLTNGDRMSVENPLWARRASTVSY
jgi:hypothetical protein